ncbi:hypothetical protein GCM10010428_22500 [Actinosynnema pretiosum subsp. pretiosum]
MVTPVERTGKPPNAAQPCCTRPTGATEFLTWEIRRSTFPHPVPGPEKIRCPHTG